MAHRGASQQAPENTLAAYRLALAAGASALECDVQLSRDGQPVLLHDDTLRRTAGRPGRVGDYTFRELRTMDVGRWKGSAFAEERIPHLDEFLQLCRGRARPIVELKPEGGSPATIARAAVSALERTRFSPEDATILAGSGEALRTVKELLPSVQAMLLVEGTPTRLGPRERLFQRCRESGFDALGVEDVGASLDAGFFRRARAYGLSVYVWTVDEPGEVLRLARAGADSIGTNDPAGALRVLS